MRLVGAVFCTDDVIDRIFRLHSFVRLSQTVVGTSLFAMPPLGAVTWGDSVSALWPLHRTDHDDVLAVCPEPVPAPATVLSAVVCVGVVMSYVPQIARIVNARSSQGFSSFFLLLGASSSTLSFLNALVLHAPILHCTVDLHLGLLQVGLQWSMFVTLCVLFLVYFPTQRSHPDYTHALYVLSAAAAACLAITVTTFVLLIVLHPQSLVLARWNAILGLGSAALSASQYLPQIYHTLRVRVPASLSIPMMLVQAPGSFVFVIALALQPAADWTTCLAFLVTGSLQSALLVLCVTLRADLRRRGLDDWGNPLLPPASYQEDSHEHSPLLQ